MECCLASQEPPSLLYPPFPQLSLGGSGPLYTDSSRSLLIKGFVQVVGRYLTTGTPPLHSHPSKLPTKAEQSDSVKQKENRITEI